MKKKLLPLLLALVLGAQSLSACEWCGQKGAQHGMILNTLTTLAYMLRSFTGFQGIGNYWENSENGKFADEEEESLSFICDTPPEDSAIVLIPRNEANLDTLTAAAQAGQILLAVNECMYEESNGTPVLVEGTDYYGLENPIAYRLSIVLCARALLNLDLDQLQKEDQERDIHQLIEQLFARIEEVELPATETSNSAADWRGTFLRESLSNITTHWIERLDSLLPILWKEHNTLPEEQQIPEADIEFLEEPEALDSTWTHMLARCWRNFFMVGHLRELQVYAQGLPIVALIEESHAQDLQERLGDVGIRSTTETSTLNIKGPLSEG